MKIKAFPKANSESVSKKFTTSLWLVLGIFVNVKSNRNIFFLQILWPSPNILTLLATPLALCTTKNSNQHVLAPFWFILGWIVIPFQRGDVNPRFFFIFLTHSLQKEVRFVFISFINRISIKEKVENGHVQDTNVPTYMILNVWHTIKKYTWSAKTLIKKRSKSKIHIFTIYVKIRPKLAIVTCHFLMVIKNSIEKESATPDYSGQSTLVELFAFWSFKIHLKWLLWTQQFNLDARPENSNLKVNLFIPLPFKWYISYLSHKMFLN